MRVEKLKQRAIFLSLLMSISVWCLPSFVVRGNSLPNAAGEHQIAEKYAMMKKTEIEKMPVYVKSTMAGFSFALPLRVADGVYSDVEVSSESRHITGYTFHLTNPKGQLPFIVSFTKRDNTPQNQQSQTTWNTTWYDKSIDGLTKEEYLKTWRQHAKKLESFDIDGDFFAFDGAIAARWSRMTPLKSSDVQQDTTEHLARSKGSAQAGVINDSLEVEFIMKADPKHRYTLLLQYPMIYREEMYQAVTDTIIPSFKTFPPMNENDRKKAKKRYKSIFKADNLVTMNLPKGFKESYSTDNEVHYTKGDIQLAVIALPIGNESSIEGAYPTFTARQILADKYESSLKDIYKADIKMKSANIENTQTTFMLGGILTEEFGKKMKFVSLVTLSENGNAVIARALAPAQSQITTAELTHYVNFISVENKPVTFSGITVL